MSQARKPKFRVIRAWAELGHHGLPFVFSSGPIHQAYGPLMHIWERKREGLTEVKIYIPLRREKGA